MKKIIDKVKYVCIGEEPPFITSCRWHLAYAEPYDETIKFNDFESFYKYVEEDNLPNAKVGKTMFRKLPQVCISAPDLYKTVYISKDTFSGVTIRDMGEVLINPTMQTLFNNLSSDDFVKYIREVGIEDLIEDSK